MYHCNETFFDWMKKWMDGKHACLNERMKEGF
jgi:hypothetical protein